MQIMKIDTVGLQGAFFAVYFLHCLILVVKVDSQEISSGGQFP
jgi:hypothetical protein